MTFLDPRQPDAMAEEVRSGFAAAYASTPRVVGRAPGRVNLIGEHTDYNRGTCLPLALPHATYAALSPRSDGNVRVASLQEGEPWVGTLDTVGPGHDQGWAAYVTGVLWALREAGHDVPGIDVLVSSSVPLGAGLSSSAALECSVAVALAEVLGLPTDAAGRQALALACIRAEGDVAGAPTGGMDQTVSLLAAAGAALLIDFDDDSTRAVPLALADAGLALLVTDTRVSHALVDGGYAARRDDCEAAARVLGLGSLREAHTDDLDRIDDERVRRRARHIVTEIARVASSVARLEAGDWPGLGELLDASHTSMRDDFEISCAELDCAVETAVDAGALGARMTGGGFGGSSLALVPAGSLEQVAAAIDEAFARRGFTSPVHLVGDPASAASVLG